MARSLKGICAPRHECDSLRMRSVLWSTSRKMKASAASSRSGSVGPPAHSRLPATRSLGSAPLASRPASQQRHRAKSSPNVDRNRHSSVPRDRDGPLARTLGGTLGGRAALAAALRAPPPPRRPSESESDATPSHAAARRVAGRDATLGGAAASSRSMRSRVAASALAAAAAARRAALASGERASMKSSWSWSSVSSSWVAHVPDRYLRRFGRIPLPPSSGCRVADAARPHSTRHRFGAVGPSTTPSSVDLRGISDHARAVGLRPGRLGGRRRTHSSSEGRARKGRMNVIPA